MNYTFRMHDPRIGRFFAVDPLAPKYPFYSPYQFSGNRVIDMVELEGLEPAKPGSKEGESQVAFDQEAVKNNDYSFSDLFSGDKLYGNWFWHAGGTSTTAGWHKRDEYREVIMPFAVQAAESDGWVSATTWQNATFAPSAMKSEISAQTQDFLTSRIFDSSEDSFFGGAPLETLINVGRNAIFTANKATQFPATGTTFAMESDSPIFMLAFGLTGLGTKEAVGEGIIYKRVNPVTGAEYYGQAKSASRYLARQAEENAALGVEHSFQIVERAKPGLALDVAEETHIRIGGGPMKQGGKLENKRYQMNEVRYKAAGGKANKPTK